MYNFKWEKLKNTYSDKYILHKKKVIEDIQNATLYELFWCFVNGKGYSMKDNLVKELSEKYNKEEIFIKNIIQMTINKGYNLNETENIVENFLNNICFN